MNCREVRTFLSQIDGGQSIDPIPWADMNFLSSNGYVLTTTQQDHDAALAEVQRLSQVTDQMQTIKPEVESMSTEFEEDQKRAESFLFHFEKKEEKEALQQKIESEQSSLSQEGLQLAALESNLNKLIQEKSLVDRMVQYGGGYISLTGLGTIILSDLEVRAYRVDDEEFSAFVDEIKSTYAELRSVVQRSSWYVSVVRANIANIDELSDENDDTGERDDETPPATGNMADVWMSTQPQPQYKVRSPPIVWSVSIGLGKLQGDPTQIAQRFAQATGALGHFKSSEPNKLMAEEVMTALGQPVPSLAGDLQNLDKTLRERKVPQELSAGIASTILAGRMYDGSYPTDRFWQFKTVTSSYEAAAILAVMNLPYQDMVTRFTDYRSTFASWGYTPSEDTEVASAYLAIGQLDPDGVKDKVKYAISQLSNYLEYPLVAAAILASIPVFEVHEVLDLMEKAVTLLSGYTIGLERSEVVALAVRMIHGVRNEIVKQIDPTAPLANTPIQFTYAPHPGFFLWYSPIITAHHTYFSTFSGIGAFHPAHSHGIGGFAG